MNKLKLNKKIGLRIALISLALILLVSAASAVLLNGNPLNASADTTVGDRVKMQDLFKRYPVDAVIGPIDVADTYPINEDGTVGDGIIDRNDMDDGGRYTYIQDDAHKDIYGNYTNNIYGIPADRYFDVESYIYTTGVKDSAAGRTLYGWKAGIRAVTPGDTHKQVTGAIQGRLIAQNGELLGSDTNKTETASPIGIYVYYNGNKWGTTFRYSLIVPNDITTIGQGSAACVSEDGTTYYDDATYQKGDTGAALFTDFSSFLVSGAPTNTDESSNKPHIWQPRERLAGVFFDEGSRLTTIQGCATEAAGDYKNGRSYKDSVGKAAFQDCNNMRYMILPSGVTSIGSHAFYRCAQLVDTNIPSTVEGIGAKAYNGCTSLLHISLPTNNNLTIPTGVFGDCTKIKHVDNPNKYNNGVFASGTNPDSTLFVMGNKPENEILDTGAFVFEYTSAHALSALSLAGETGENPNKLFVFPSAQHFTNSSDRRRGVTYDYLDCDGNKVTISLDDLDLNVTEYDIAANFAKDTWCQNVILPKEVKVINADAFNNSHVKYLETYATTFRARSFYDDNSSNVTEQWFYFHQVKNSSGNYTAYTIYNDSNKASNCAFRDAPNKRYIILENKELYDFATGNAQFKNYLINRTGSTNQFTKYQIPVIAHVDNKDSIAVSIGEGDMASRFFNDSDYVENPTVAANTNGTIVYTKRLNGMSYTQLKQRTGAWSASDAEADSHSNPTLSNMVSKSTKWFASAANATTASSPKTAADLYNNSESALNIYTKNIARPANIADGSYDGVYKGQYTFGETYTLGGTDYTLGDAASQSIDFYKALGLSDDDYTLNVLNSNGTTKTCDFVYPDGINTAVATNLHNAGTYTFVISLNTKWGVWSSDFVNDEANKIYLNATIKVERKKLDYSTLDSIPLFVNALGDSNVMHGNSTPIYNYNDGWYVAQQNGQEPNDTSTVTNSYVYHTGKAITIKLQGEVVSADGDSSTLGDVLITSRNGVTFTNSGRYTATFQFEVKPATDQSGQPVSGQSNYYFDYGSNNFGISDNVSGLTMSNTQPRSFRLTKRWYIVVETNMFIVSGSGNASPYAPLVNTTVNYADTLSIQTPALYKGAANGTIQYEIAYTRNGGSAIVLTGKEADGSNTKLSLNGNPLSYYINSSMPAGVYTLKFYGSAASDGDKTYPAITGEYTITVLPKEFDTDTIKAIHDIMNVNGDKGNAYPLNSDEKKLHNSIADNVTALNASLAKQPALSDDNYWSQAAQASYYDNAVAITYNIDGRGNTNYYSADEALSLLTTANPYRLYYCISAQNYKTVGGADSSDRTDRVFITTLYTELRFADLIYPHITDVNGTYFKDVTYTGEVVQTRVLNNINYTHSFTDTDYVNARTKASVTLTLNNPELARWNTTAGLTEEEQVEAGKYFELSADGKSLKVFFNINQASNSWLTAPLVPGWSYGEFDAGVYTIMGTLSHQATVHYFITTSATSADDKFKVTDEFTVDELGQIVDPNPTAANSITSQLNKLDVGTYYLGSRADATADGNVKAFDTLSVNGATYSPIILRQAYNDWDEYPGMTSWQYKGFAVSTNFAAGSPKFITYQTVEGNKTANVATYTVSQDSTVLATFKANDSDIESKLKDLTVRPQNTYYTLHVTYPGDNNYFAMNYRMPFSVLKADNPWTTTPGMTGWVYNQLTNGNNFRAGVPTFNEDSEKTITYVLTKQNAAKFVINGAEVDSYTLTLNGAALATTTVTALNTLSVGDYKLTATLLGTDNYRQAYQEITFAVSAIANTWTTSPNMAGWQYGSFAIGNFRAGVPQFPLTNKVVQYGIFKNRDTATQPFAAADFDADSTTGELFSNISAVETYLKGLEVGTYYLVAYVQGNSDYADLITPVSFSVTQATINAWTTIPSISGWTYNQFATSIVTGGAAQFGDVVYSVKKGINDENGIDGFNKLDLDALTSTLKTLPAGSYYLVAETVISNNYVAATRSIGFTVAKADNTWATYPSINGWVYGASNVAYADKPDTKGVVAAITTAVAGEATVDGIAYAFYPATQRNGEWVPVTDAEAITLSATTPYGNYVMVATAKGTDNFNDLTHTVHFTVSKSGNNWENEPEGTFTWTWGAVDAVITDQTGFLTALAHFMPKDELVTYTVKGVTDPSFSATATKSKKDDGTFDRQSVIDMLKQLGVGDYEITVSVEETTNYAGISKTTYVTVSPATITVTQDPACSGWTWGAANKTFTAMTATVLDGDTIKITYTLGGKDYTDTDALMADLGSKPVGTHTVTVTASCDNYTTVTRNIDVAISEAKLTVTDPECSGWTWDDDDSVKTFTAMQATPALSSDVVKYNYNFENNDYSNSDAVLALLKIRDAGTYVVIVTATCDNHTTETRVVTVEIKQADNEWTANEPQKHYDVESSVLEGHSVLQAVAKHGDVRYYEDEECKQPLMHGEVEVTTAALLNMWIHSLRANDTVPYEYYTAVKETVNYKGLCVKTELLITGTKSYWTNKDRSEIEETVNYVYADDLFANKKEEITGLIPVVIPTEEGVGRGTTTYTLSYKGITDEQTAPKYNVNDVITWIYDQSSAGTYVIDAKFVPELDTYTTIYYTLTIEIERATPKWKDTLKSDDYYYGQYSKIEVGNITLDGYSTADVTVLINVPGSENAITLVIRNGLVAVVNDELIKEADRLTFAKYAQTLPAVQTYYEVAYSVVQTANYFGLGELKSRLYISPIVNTWLDSDKWTNGHSFEFTRGDPIVVDVPTAVTGNDQLIIKFRGTETGYKTAKEFNDHLADLVKDNELKAGTYPLVFTIPATNNYNGLVSNCQIVIKLKDNQWTSTLKDYIGNGNVILTGDKAFSMPQAVTSAIDIGDGGKAIDLLRFDVVKVGTSSSWPNLDLEAFTDLLKTNEITNGTFTVTARIGGTGYGNISDRFESAVNKYNDDYQSLVSTCTIILTPDANSWDVTDFPNKTWTYGDTVTVTIPAAAHGNDTLEISIRKGSETATVFSTKSEGEEFKTKFINHLNGLHAGTYTVSISVAGTNVYYAPETLTAVYVVSPVTTKWNLTDTELANYEYVLGTWGSFANDALPNLEVANWSGAKIIYAVDGKDLVNDPSTPATDESHWVYALANLSKAGTYTFTATVKGDGDHTDLSLRVTVIASVSANNWQSHMNTNNVEDYTVTWTFGAASGNTAIVFKAKNNNDKLTFTVNGGRVAVNEGETALAALQRTLLTLGAGEHAIVASVPADEQYGALSETIKLTINKADNEWLKQLAINGWVWNDVSQYKMSPTFTVPVPAQGTTANITVRKGNDIVLEASVNYTGTGSSKTVNENDKNALVSKLCALDVGTYTISVVVNETDNYAALSAGITVNNGVTTYNTEFTITKADNAWETNPTITGWSFGGDIIYPSAIPMFGKNTVQFMYTEATETATAPSADAKWSDAPGYKEGFYWLRTSVPGTDNYNELTHYLKFQIGAGQNSWVKYPGVIAWNWNGYDKNANLFSGSARSDGQVSYTITVDDGSQAGKQLSVSDFNSYGGKIVVDESTIQTIRNYLKDFTLDVDGKVSDTVADVLNALCNGNYLLTATAASGESLDSITSSARFVVGKANNEWTTVPNVLSFDFGATTTGDNRKIFTAGAAKYGDEVIYTINGTDNNSNSVTLTGLTAANIEALINGEYAKDGNVVILNAGNYYLSAVVTAKNSDPYNSLNTTTLVYFSVSRIANSWVAGNTPKTSVDNVYYAVLRAKNDNNEYTFDFTAWFGNPLATDGSVQYALLKTNYQPAVDGSFDYAQLPAAIRGLPTGDYIVRINVAATCNHLALTADTSVSILRYANSFTKFPEGNLSGTWHQAGNGVDNATTLTDFDNDIAAEYGEITYTIGTTSKVSYSEFKAAVTALNAGSYQVVIEVAQTDDYNGLSRTVQLDIAPGTNVLTWSIVSTWKWHNGLTRDDGESYRFLAEKPLYGTQITVEITNKNDSNSSSTVTVNFADSNPLAIINQIISGKQESDIIGGLGAGEYTIRVTASATTNWAAVSESTTFIIEKALNKWTAAPALSGTPKDDVYSYSYGDAFAPTATAKYGTAKYTYYNAADYGQDNAEPLSGKPANVGSYVVEIAVDETDNYLGIAATVLYFDIVKVLNDSFIVSPSAVGWTWGSYDRTVHMFAGIPRSGGNVSFSILDENKVIMSINGTALDRMLLVGLIENGEYHYNDVDKDMYLEKDFAALVAQLKEGSYYLQINVDATNNNTEFTATTPFRVTAAENGWKITPKIASWSLELFDPKVNMPQAEPRFGTAHVVVTSQNNDEVYYDSKLGINRLENALAGWYKMTVTVAAEPGCYNGLDETVYVQVYMRGSNETKNYWYETYGINGWEAIVDGIGNKPYGTPLRGLPYFEFYYAKRDANNQLVIDMDRPVVEGEDSYLISKGDNKYYKDFYVPMAPGDYFMIACAVNVDSEGNVIEADNLRETDEKAYPLHIENRANSFKDDPRIDTLLFLGDRDQWTEPTATASLAGSEIWFTYQNADTGADLGKNKPTVEGNYIVIAHAIAKYSREITKEAKFTVELSTNEWIDIPTMENWSEETEEKMVEWSSKFDADEIIYTYENVETGEKFNSKPTTEGTYKVTATIKKVGYHDLVGTTTFTIEPAFDPDLLKVDIALGVAACALALFVIIFAIRRYKEN